MAERTLACSACHGEQGRATAEGHFPRIAGKPMRYLHNQLLNFRDGRRQQALMAGLTAQLSDAYLLEMAQHFAGLDLPYPAPQTQRVPEASARLARRLVFEGDPARRIAACAACHGQALTGVRPAIPGLLGLPRDYLVEQIGSWKSGQRRAHAPDCMAEQAAALTPADIAAVALWLSAQPLPADPRAAAGLPAPLPLRCGSAPELGAAR